MKFELSRVTDTMFIAGTRQPPYLRSSMIRLLSSFLVALILFLSPLMMANGAGMAMPHAAAAANAQTDNHCAGDQAPSENQKSPAKASCASACAAFPAVSPAPSGVAPAVRLAIVASRPRVLSGIHPEGELRPPRNTPEI